MPEDSQPLLDGNFISRIEQLRLKARGVFEGVTHAERRSNRAGSGLEFADYRDYARGDDPRRVDWNIYGRLDRLVREGAPGGARPRGWRFLVDCSGSMRWAPEGGGEDEMAPRTAARRGAFLPRPAQSGPGGASGFSTPTCAHSAALPRPRPPSLELLRFLETPPSPSSGTLLEPSLRNFSVRLRRARPGDRPQRLPWDPGGFDKGLMALAARRFETHVIQILDPAECEPPLSGDLLLRDGETGAEMALTATPALRRAYEKEFSRFRESVLESCKRRGAGHTLAMAGQEFDDVILRNLGRTGSFNELPLSSRSLGRRAASGGRAAVSCAASAGARTRFRRCSSGSRRWASSPRQRFLGALRHPISLVLQLLIFILLLLAAAHMRFEGSLEPRSTAVVLDARARMQPVFEKALAIARSLAAQAGPAEEIAMIDLEGPPRILSVFSRDPRALRGAPRRSHAVRRGRQPAGGCRSRAKSAPLAPGQDTARRDFRPRRSFAEGGGSNRRGHGRRQSRNHQTLRQTAPGKPADVAALHGDREFRRLGEDSAVVLLSRRKALRFPQPCTRRRSFGGSDRGSAGRIAAPGQGPCPKPVSRDRTPSRRTTPRFAALPVAQTTEVLLVSPAIPSLNRR